MDSMISSFRLVSPRSPRMPSLSISIPAPRSWIASASAVSPTLSLLAGASDPMIARSSVLSALEDAVQHGSLTIIEGSDSYVFGDTYNNSPGPHAVLRVTNEAFWSRILVSVDLGFSEAFMIGDVEVDDLKSIMDLWLDNQNSMQSLPSTFNRVVSLASGISNAFVGQTRSRARLNAIAAYDQSNDLFISFLSKEMMYSCALWGPEEGGTRGDLDALLPGAAPRPSDDLERAQHRKIHHLLKKLRLRKGANQRLLEFGSGWGGLAIEAARSYGCQVDSITLSQEQKVLAEERIRAAGLEDKVRIHLMDYRELPPEFEKAFDAFVSVEMIEHVGAKYYNTYFSIVDWALKSENAAAVITSSTYPECRFTTYQAEDFSRRYIWPNSCLPSATSLVTAANTASQGRFTLEGVENHGSHYARTLRDWGRRLDANLTPDTVPDLRGCSRADFGIFKRKWQYLFVYASSGFVKGYITCHMLTFTRQNDSPELPC